MKELKNKIKEQEILLARLRADVASMECKTDLLVQNKKYEVELEMRKLIEEAYDKGFNACQRQFKVLKELQSSLAL